MSPVPMNTLTPSSDAIAGRIVLGRYRIIRSLGRGGTGVVYLGRTEGAAGFSKPVVVKRLLPNLVRDPVHATMLVREARILANLKHAGIVGVVDLGEEDDAYVMVLEYVHGYDLGHWLKYLRLKERRLPPDIALEISIRVLEALNYAHNLKKPDGTSGCVIHRDVSPSNILLDLDGNVRLLDFGIAHVTDELADLDTKRNLFKGKVGYSHPTLLKLGSPSATTDTYSAAVVTLQMLVGINPFYAESTSATIDRVLNKPLPRLRDFVPDASSDLEAILLKALSRDPDAAYSSALALADALRTQRAMDPEEVAIQLRALIQADFVGEMPSLLQLEALEVRDHAWRSFAAGHSEGLRRMSRPPESGEPTAVLPGAGAYVPRGELGMGVAEVRRETRATSGEDATLVASYTKASNLAGYRYGIAALVLTFATVLGVVWSRKSPNTLEPRYLVVSAEGASNPGVGVRPIESSPRPAPQASDLDTEPVAPAPTNNGTGVEKGTVLGKVTPREPTPQYLTQVFTRRQGQIQGCFNHARDEQSNMTLQVAFQVDVAGKVTSASVSPAAVAATPLGSCILGVARGTRFGTLTQSANFRIPLRVHVR